MSPAPTSTPPPTAPHPDLLEYYPEAGARRRFVDDLFDRGAPHYDWIVRLMSFGSGARYRRDALQRAGIGPGMTVLDVATGPGIIAGAARELVGSAGRVLGVDASLGMLREAQRRAAIPLARGLAEELPLASGSVDAITMGYALRHVRDLEETFREYRRVLRPGGTLLVLELTRPRPRTLTHGAVRFYLKTLVPGLVRLRGGRDAAMMMHYFWDTIEQCVPPQSILGALAAAGFQQTRREVVLQIFSEYTARA
jgi:demethylmenaquinone methyltransferase/2-methoxy-6-polyprenyl-1,4-benzoquinol methylase